MPKRKKIRLGIIGNSSQVRQHYVKHLCDRAKLPCEVEIAWVSGCRCLPGSEYGECPFRAPNVPQGLKLGFDPSLSAPCIQVKEVKTPTPNVDYASVDAVLVSLPNHLHAQEVRRFLGFGVPVAVDKPPVLGSADARRLVRLAESKKIPFVTLAQRRFEDVYLLMAEKIRKGELGKIQLINLLFVHGWTPMRPGWRSKRSLAGGGVLIDSVFNCLDVLLWLLRQSDDPPKATAVHAHWDLQDPRDPDTVEVRITVGVKFNSGCLLNITAANTALSRDSVDEDIKIFGSKGVLRYQRDMVSRKSMVSGQLTFRTLRFPEVTQILVPAGQGTGLRNAPFADFLECVHDRQRQPKSPARDSIEVLEIIEKAYRSAENGGILIKR